jgi:RecA-family ATPase
MKVGKSTLIYELALSVARGKPFLGFPTRQGRVLILAVEENRRDARHRLIRLGLRRTDRIHLWAKPLDPRWLRALRAYIRKHNVRLVILDTLASYWRIKNENDNAEVIRGITPLERLARETGAAVLIIHHDRKGGGPNGESIRGGSGLFAKVDQALMLRRVGSQHPMRRRLLRDGRYNEAGEGRLISRNSARVRG